MGRQGILYLILYFVFPLCGLAQSETTWLYALENEKDATKKADIMYQLGSLYHTQQGYEKAISYFDKALPLIASPAKMQDIRQKMLQAYGYLEQYEKAIKVGETVANEAKKANDQTAWTQTINALGHYAQKNNDYPLAKKYHDELWEFYNTQNSLKGKALTSNNLGVIHRRMNDMDVSQKWFEESIKLNERILEKETNVLERTLTYINIGVTYIKLNQIDLANQNFNLALENAGDNPKAQATALNYSAMGKYLEDESADAIRLALNAKQTATLWQDSENIIHACQILKMIYEQQNADKEAKEYAEIANQEQKKRDNQRQKERNYLTQKQIEIEKKEAEIQNTIAEAAKRDAQIREDKLEKEKREKEIENQKQALVILQRDKDLAIAKVKEQEAEQIRTRQLLEITQQKAETERQKAETERQKAETDKQKLLVEKEHAENEIKTKDLKAKGIQLQYANEQKKLQDAKLRQEQIIRYLGIGVIFLIIAILLYVYRSLRVTRKLNNQIKEQVVELQEQKEEIQQHQEEIIAQRDSLASQNEIINIEREKSDKLLLNILPEEVAQELKETGKTQVRHFESVTVLFADVKGFSALAKKVTPQELIAELDATFSKMDEISLRYNVERIKTIGDCYMACGGLPEANETHAVDVVLAALGIQQWMNDEYERRNGNFWQVRLGMHTGEAVAGVIGTTKFAYDIWGNTVNLASRMESGGEVGRVNVTQATFDLVSPYCVGEYREEIEAKNIGKVSAFFIDRLKPEYSADARGIEPNELFWTKWKEKTKK